jgi:lysophospholipase L1-like esterase
MDEKAASSICKEIQLFIEFCQDRDIQIILVEMPVPAKTKSFYQEKYISQTHKIIHQLSLHSNVTHLNCKDSLVFKNDSLFADADHLNQKGAEIFTKMLNNTLVKLNAASQSKNKEIKEPERF